MYLWTGRQDGTETTKGVSSRPKLREEEVVGYLRMRWATAGVGRWWAISEGGGVLSQEVLCYLRKEVVIGYLRRRW
jgi:hypothetical protein